MARIAILLTESYREHELEFLRSELADAEHEVVIAGLSDGQVTITGAQGSTMRVDAAFDVLEPTELCGAILPDGNWPDGKVLDERTKRFLRVLHMAGRPIAALSGGIRMLLAAGIGSGCKITASESDRSLLEHAGATWIDAPVTSYGHILSARGEESITDLMAKFLPAVETFQKQTPPTAYLLEDRPPS